MTRRAPNGSGSVFLDAATGRWVAEISLGTGPDGRRRRRRVYARSREAAAAKLALIRAGRPSDVTSPAAVQVVALEARLVAAQQLVDRLCIILVAEQEAVPLARALTALGMTAEQYHQVVDQAARRGKQACGWWA